MAVKKVSLNGRAFGQRHWKADLTDREVEVIRQLYDEGMTVTDIANQMEVPRTTISNICLHIRRNVSERPE